MFKGLLGVAVAVFLAVTGYEAWDYYTSVDHPQALLTTEAALATQELVALASVSIEHAVRLEAAFVGIPDTAGAAAQGLLEGTPFARLQSAGIDPRRDLRHMVFALYLGDDEDPGYALAVLGNFDETRVLTGLSGEYEVSPAPSGQPRVWQIRKQNIDSCEWSRPWYLFVSGGLIVAADPERMPALLRRFGDRATAQRDLERWREFRADQLGSLALFVPENAPKTGNRFIQQPVSKAYGMLDAFSEVYFGMGVSPLPFRARFELMLAGEDAHAASALAAGWQAALMDSKKQWGKQMPTAARLHDALAVSHANGALRMTASVDRAWLQDAAKIPQELMGMLFSGSGISMSSPNGAVAPQERIDENPTHFLREIGADTLPRYQPETPFLPEADTVSGPFGIQLSAVELSDQTDAGLELTISATHRGIPNLGDGKQRVQLYVESVTDAQGNELLRDETCGRERNALPAGIDKPHFGNSLKGEKTVRLKTNTRQEDIHRIRGRVELLLPVKTESVLLATLDQEHSIDRDGVRVVLRRSGTDTLNYKVYGDSRRVLALRGLNGAAQPLAGTSSMAGGFLFGEGLSKSQSFAGQVASAELVLATSDVEKRFPFEISGARPRVSRDESRHAPASVPPYSPAQLQRDFKTAPALPVDARDIKAETTSGPFRITLDRLRSSLGLQAGFKVYAPPVPGMADSLAALALEVTAIENAAGNNLMEADRQSGAVQLSQDWQEKSRLQGQVNLRFETKAEAADIRKLKGALHLRLPRKVQSVIIDSMTVGTRVHQADGPITLRRIDDQGFILDFGSRQPALLAVNVYNAQGESLWVPDPRIEIKNERWLGRFDTHGTFEKIELLLATQQEEKSLPFELSLSY
ncbi:MAG: hypothetical protein PVH25_09210 [Burkholderiales bacterium]|jgi:hypothetical protein